MSMDGSAPVRIYEATLTLWEHTFFASREIGLVYETEPLIGNYALAYALGMASAPYRWTGGPRYAEDLGPLNAAGLYVTPAAFDPARLRFVLSLFNAQADSYFSLFTNNAIVAPPNGWTAIQQGQRWSLVNPETGERRQVRPANFPQSGRLRMLGLGSVARFYLLADETAEADAALERARLRPIGRQYVRLGKFNSKAEVRWRRVAAEPVEGLDLEVDAMLNAVDLPTDAHVVPLAATYVHPAPVLGHCLYSGSCWRLEGGGYLPRALRFGGVW